MQAKRDAASHGDEESCTSYSINSVPSTKNITRGWSAGSDNDTFEFVVHMPSEAPSVSSTKSTKGRKRM